jgi:hypothetical protein
MIFPVNLKVFSKMLDPAGEKRDLHIRTAGILVMQLELLEIQRLVALSHNEGPIVAEEAGFATAQRPKAQQWGVLWLFLEAERMKVRGSYQSDWLNSERA